jgi:hypothetical protein
MGATHWIWLCLQTDRWADRRGGGGQGGQEAGEVREVGGPFLPSNRHGFVGRGGGKASIPLPSDRHVLGVGGRNGRGAR